MSTVDISLKHFGITVEFQVDEKRFYVNPHEEHEDRRPEDGDFIVSFLRGGLSDLNIKSETARQLTGLKCYGYEQTRYILDDQLRAQWRSFDSSQPSGTAPKIGKGIQSVEDTLMDIDDVMFGTEVLKSGSQTYGIGINFDSIRFIYFHVDEAFVPAFMEESATCAILVVDNWKKYEEAVRKIIFEKKSDFFYLVCDQLRKNELNALVNFLPQDIVDRVICKKSKWKFPVS